ncbi:MAG: type IX secretion system sortase PorU [Bacteroidales bacterium]|nr:type IX secretion system sortase PorU [Bacteroidales bacterium]
MKPYKPIFVFILSCVLTASFAHSLEWHYSLEPQGGRRWSFEGAVQLDEGLPLYSETLLPQEDLQSLEIRFPVWEEIKGKDLQAYLPLLDDFPDSLELHINKGIQRKQAVWDLYFHPFLRKNGRYFRLLSFEWAYIRESATSVLEKAAHKDKAANVSLFSDQQGRVAPALRYAESSRLSTGKFVKISVENTGIYKLSFEDLRKMGVDPAKVQLYGYGGQLLPEDFTQPYIDDLPELSFYKDEEQGYLLFYALGPLSWNYEASKGLFTRLNNHYSTKAYYFVGERSGGSRPTEVVSSLSQEADYEVRAYTAYALHEKDLYNLGGTGRECYGEDLMSNPDLSLAFSFDHILTGEHASIVAESAARSTLSGSTRLYVDDSYLGSMNYSAISGTDSYTYARGSSLTKTFLPKDDKIQVRLQYNSNGVLPKRAHLNYVTINARCRLVLNSAYMAFRDPKSLGAGKLSRFCLESADASTLVFEIGRTGSMKQILGELKGTEFQFVLRTDSLREFVAVNTRGNFPKPVIEGQVPNQDLHALGAQDFIIITHPDFIDEAEELAQAHRLHDKLRVMVVTTEQVYNEFSSGTPDATAYRRFLKMFYDRATRAEDIPQSLLLFGDGVYDNRLVTAAFSSGISSPNKILTFQSKESLEGTSSYVTDDYFGFLDDNEGINLPYDKMDIGIGRFPVRSKAEARIAVDKTLAYINNRDKGSWKNQLCFIGDDGDNNTHVSHADKLAESVKSNNPEFMAHKIYVDAYQRETSSAGTTVPGANKRMAELLGSGLLLLNYSGHGSTTTWASEQLLTIGEIREMQNKRLPLWVTATCDFCRYDDAVTSGGEYVFLNERGGGIALFTTSRVVYSGPNYTINKSFIDNIFATQSGRRLSLGEVMCRTKQSESLKYDRNKLNFALIGDPALKLSYPEYKLEITQINGRDLQAGLNDTLSALSTVEFSGRVLDYEGNFAEDFEGLLYPTVYDAEDLINTLGNSGNDVFSYYDRSKVLFAGKEQISKGRFNFRFIVPKDQSYSYKPGMINLYAHNQEGDIEAQGVFEKFLIGGTNSAALPDSTGPRIRLFLNDTSFVDGDKVNTSPSLIALLQDESGINMSGSSFGHDLVLTINGRDRHILNNYYESDLGSGSSGRIIYNLPELETGRHQLSLRAWDLQNNSSLASVDFQVVEDLSPNLQDLNFYQNSEKAWFSFRHDRPASWMQVEFRVYDIWGRLQWQKQVNMMNPDNSSQALEWNYVGENGRRVENGVYICRLFVVSGNNEQAVTAKKIMVGLQ